MSVDVPSEVPDGTQGLRWVEAKLSVELSPAYLGNVRSGISAQLGASMLR